jgi:hypothetical protein
MQGIKVGNFSSQAMNLGSISKQITLEFDHYLSQSRQSERDKRATHEKRWWRSFGHRLLYPLSLFS